MENTHVDLKKEQQSSLARPRYKYSLAARFFFVTMDLIAGKETTLSKTKLLEILASIPYRAWEIRQYARMTHRYRSRGLVEQARSIMTWSREAQDNEYSHLLAINEKMKQDQVKDSWYLCLPVRWLMVTIYVLLCRAMALVNIRRAFLFNAEFEDHAEHTYAQFVEDHPELEDHQVNNELVKEFWDLDTWADVFRRIALDERDHMNHSFIFSGKPECVVEYEGMPISPSAESSQHQK